MKNISAVILGSSGFIGTRLCKYLSSRNVAVEAAIDLVDPREPIREVQFRRADVRETIPPALCTGANIIYNLAAVHRTPGHPEHEYYETNVQGAINAVNLADACGIKTIVFTSSISVYGPSEELLTETSPPKPVSAYGRSKRVAEAIHRQWLTQGHGRRLIIVRPGVVFGPGERGNYTHLAKALSKGYFFYPGRDDAIKSGGYVDELLRTIDFAVNRDDEYTLFNFAYPEMSSTKDIVTAFGLAKGKSFNPPTVPLLPMLIGAQLFEGINAIGFKSPIHRERVLKLVQSTKIEPRWLKQSGYVFESNLKSALEKWHDESGGTFE